MRKLSRKSWVEKTGLGTKPGKVKQVSVPLLFTAFIEMLMNAEELAESGLPRTYDIPIWRHYGDICVNDTIMSL